jgi:hypothetical protein
VRRGAGAVQVRRTGRRTIRSEIRLANSLPPITAMPVQMAWPMIAPRVTPKGSLAAACIVDHAMECMVHCYVTWCVAPEEAAGLLSSRLAQSARTVCE